MKKVFIVLFNMRVSQEGYDTYEKAKEFVLNRYGQIKQLSPYTFIRSDTEDSCTYNIVEVDVK